MQIGIIQILMILSTTVLCAIGCALWFSDLNKKLGRRAIVVIIVAALINQISILLGG